MLDAVLAHTLLKAVPEHAQVVFVGDADQLPSVGAGTVLTDLIESGAMLGLGALIVAVAIGGKLGGTALAARASGHSWRTSLSLGTLMNTRGLMELVVINIGLEEGIISPPLYVLLVVMALATTLMTTPMLNALRAPSGRSRPAVP